MRANFASAGLGRGTEPLLYGLLEACAGRLVDYRELERDQCAPRIVVGLEQIAQHREGVVLAVGEGCLLELVLRLHENRVSSTAMCRNIRQLFNFEPPATEAEIQAAALQFVRKVSGTRQPRGKNLDVFDRAVEDITRATRVLVEALETTAPPKNREEEAVKAKARNAKRFG